MDIREILKKVDHTLLGVTAGWSDIEQILIDAEKFGTASACIPPEFVKRAKDYVGDRVKICTVIGFPNGYNTTAAKVFETEDAVANGAGRDRYGHKCRRAQIRQHRLCRE